MTDIDIDAIRQQVPFIWAHWSAIQDTPQPGLVTDRLICTQQSADDVPTVLRWVEKLTAKVDELTAALAKSREQVADYAADNRRAVAQLTAANRRADGLDNDLRSAVTANTAYANENARLRSTLATVEEIGTALDQTDEKNAQADRLNEQYHGYGARLLYAVGKAKPAEATP